MTKILHLVLLMSLLVAPVAVCSAEDTKIGVIVPLTGPFARYGNKIQKAITEFADDHISFVFEDEGCDPMMAVNSYKKLTEINRINLFLGPWCGSPQSAVAPQLKKGEQLAVLGSSAPEAVFTASNGNMFSTQHSIEAESTFLGQKLNERGVSSVIIVFKENAFSRAHEAAFRNAFKGKIFTTIAYSSDDISDLKNIALKVKQMQPDALYVPDAFPLMAGLTKELRALGVEKKIYSVYSAQSEDVMNALGVDGEKLIYSYPDIGDQDALNYFPTMATKILVNAAKACSGEVKCIHEAILKQDSFNDHGVLSGQLVLKTIKNGKFMPLE